MITTLAQLQERNRKLKILDEQGMLSSDEAVRIKSEEIKLDWRLLEEETQGTWKWTALQYDYDKKEGFYYQLKILQEDGHLCFLPALLNDTEYYTVRVMTDLTFPVLKDIFGKFGTFYENLMIKIFWKKNYKK